MRQSIAFNSWSQGGLLASCLVVRQHVHLLVLQPVRLSVFQHSIRRRVQYPRFHPFFAIKFDVITLSFVLVQKRPSL